MERAKGGILTVTMNPAIDIQYRVAGFQADRVFRSKAPLKTPGGKGLNVSRVMGQMGRDVTATGVLGGDSGAWIRKQLSATCIRDRFISIDSDTRECIAIIGEKTQTEILGSGTSVTDAELSHFLREFETLSEDHSIICISGSLPEGVPGDLYRELVSIGKSHGCRVILDSSGPSLRNALCGGPFLIKPNREELEAVSGRSVTTIGEIREACEQLRKEGAENILVSLGSEGGIFVGKETYLLRIPEIQVKNPVGSGDASVAGFAYGLSEGLSIKESLSFSMACGLSNTMNEGTGSVVFEDVMALKDDIEIIRV